MGDCTKLFHCIVIILGFLNCVCVGHACVLPVVCMHVEARGLTLSSLIVFIHIYVFKHFLFYAGVFLCIMCVPGALRLEEEVRFAGTGVTA